MQRLKKKRNAIISYIPNYLRTTKIHKMVKNIIYIAKWINFMATNLINMKAYLSFINLFI